MNSFETEMMRRAKMGQPQPQNGEMHILPVIEDDLIIIDPSPSIRPAGPFDQLFDLQGGIVPLRSSAVVGGALGALLASRNRILGMIVGGVAGHFLVPRRGPRRY